MQGGVKDPPNYEGCIEVALDPHQRGMMTDGHTEANQVTYEQPKFPTSATFLQNDNKCEPRNDVRIFNSGKEVVFSLLRRLAVSRITQKLLNPFSPWWKDAVWVKEELI